MYKKKPKSDTLNLSVKSNQRPFEVEGFSYISAKTLGAGGSIAQIFPPPSPPLVPTVLVSGPTFRSVFLSSGSSRSSRTPVSEKWGGGRGGCPPAHPPAPTVQVSGPTFRSVFLSSGSSRSSRTPVSENQAKEKFPWLECSMNHTKVQTRGSY